MTNRQLYMEKRKEVHTPEEFLAAFEDSAVFVFALSEDRTVFSKTNLLGGIWMINSDAIITEADLCVMSVEPTAHRKQFLVIDKNGNEETHNRILDLIEKSGVVPCCYVAFKEKKNGIKRCFLKKFDNKTTALLKKMNLLFDGEDWLVTVRHFSKVDRKAAENMEEQK